MEANKWPKSCWTYLGGEGMYAVCVSMRVCMCVSMCVRACARVSMCVRVCTIAVLVGIYEIFIEEGRVVVMECRQGGMDDGVQAG